MLHNDPPIPKDYYMLSALSLCLFVSWLTELPERQMQPFPSFINKLSSISSYGITNHEFWYRLLTFAIP